MAARLPSTRSTLRARRGAEVVWVGLRRGGPLGLRHLLRRLLRRPIASEEVARRLREAIADLGGVYVTSGRRLR